MERGEQAKTAWRVFGIFFYTTRSTSADRSRMVIGQQLSRSGPDGLDMTCREHRIRELDIYIYIDVNAGLVIGWYVSQTLD